MGRTLRKLLIAAVSLLVLGALVYRSQSAIRLQDFNWERLWHALQQARPGLLLLSLLTIYVGYAVRALRWQRFCRNLGQPRFWSLYSSTVMGFTALFLLGRAGEPLRPLLIARKDRLPVSSMFGIYVLERLFDGASTVIIGGLSLMMLAQMRSPNVPAAAWEARARDAGLVLMTLLLAGFVFVVYLRVHGSEALERGLHGWREQGGWRRRLAGILLSFLEGLQGIQSAGDLLAAVLYSALHWTLVGSIYLWVPRAFGLHLRPNEIAGALLVLFFTLVGSMLQLPAVGGGSQVASFLAFTVVFGVEKEPAAAAAVVLWLVTFAASSLVGVPLLVREGWSMGELRRLARAEAEAEAAGAHAGVGEAPAKPGESPR